MGVGLRENLREDPKGLDDWLDMGHKDNKFWISKLGSPWKNGDNIDIKLRK